MYLSAPKHGSWQSIQEGSLLNITKRGWVRNKRKDGHQRHFNDSSKVEYRWAAVRTPRKENQRKEEEMILRESVAYPGCKLHKTEEIAREFVEATCLQWHEQLVCWRCEKRYKRRYSYGSCERCRILFHTQGCSRLSRVENVLRHSLDETVMCVCYFHTNDVRRYASAFHMKHHWHANIVASSQ